MRRLTKRALRAAGIYNSHMLCQQGRGTVYLSYRPYSSVERCATGWQVIGIGFKTDDAAAWMNNGCKLFMTFGRDDREQRLTEAKDWASLNYGIVEWVRDPFGAWQARGAYENVALSLSETARKQK